MHCPNCGNESPFDQKFCRKCGFDLGPVGELIRGAKSDGELAKLERAEREAFLVRHMFRWIAWGLIVLGLGAFALVLNKTYDLGKLFRLASTLIVLAGTGMAAYGVISAVTRGARPRMNAGTDKKDELPSATTRELAGNAMPISIPSVTERTTELIGEKNLPK
jgi:hypothetical protein